MLREIALGIVLSLLKLLLTAGRGLLRLLWLTEVGRGELVGDGMVGAKAEGGWNRNAGWDGRG